MRTREAANVQRCLSHRSWSGKAVLWSSVLCIFACAPGSSVVYSPTLHHGRLSIDQTSLLYSMPVQIAAIAHEHWLKESSLLGIDSTSDIGIEADSLTVIGLFVQVTKRDLYIDFRLDSLNVHSCRSVYTQHVEQAAAAQPFDSVCIDSVSLYTPIMFAIPKWHRHEPIDGSLVTSVYGLVIRPAASYGKNTTTSVPGMFEGFYHLAGDHLVVDSIKGFSNF